MSKRPQIFLESHNINNMYTGFGHFNYWLIRSLTEINTSYDFTVYGSHKSAFRDFGDKVKFKKYYSLNRYPSFRIRKKYDLWHSLNQNTKIEPYHDLPYLITMHDVIFLEKDPIELVNKRKLQQLKDKVERSDVIVFISEHAKRSANEFLNIPSSVPQPVIYNGNPVTAREPVIPEKVPVQSRPFLFCLGQFLEMKNFHSLVGMLAELKDYDLVLAGNSDKPYGEVVKQEIRKHNLEDRVFMPGKITEQDKHYYLQNCEAFLFPSLFEGFGLPPIEAKAYGKPVFLANRTSLPEIGGEFAFYWDHFEPDSMKQVFEAGMEKFQINKDLYRDNLINRAKSFSWEKTAREYLDVYKSIL